MLKSFLTKIITRLSNKAGYSLVIRKKGENFKDYESIVPAASYAPWLSDPEFRRCYGAITKGAYTLVDRYRAYELWQLVQQSMKLKGSLIEVGTWRGGTGALISRRASLLGIRDKVYLCDTFKGVVKAGNQDSTYRGGEHSDASKKDVEEILGLVGANNAEILVGIFPDETGEKISGKKFLFVHIDVDTYGAAKDSFNFLWPKVVPGGIVVFDDYGFRTCDGVRNFVEEIRPNIPGVVIHNLNGHAVIIKF